MMKTPLISIFLVVVATTSSAQTRIAFTTAPAPGGLVDAAQKARDRAVKDLVDDFTKRATKDHVVVVGPAEAQVVVTVLSMRVDPNGESTKETHRGVFGGVQGSEKQEVAEHMVVELRAGDYTTKIDGWRTIIQQAEDQVGREIRRWLKDNAKQLP